MTVHLVTPVEYTAHAEEKLDEIGIAKAWLTRKMHLGDGYFYRDTEADNDHRYDFYIPGKEYAAVIQLERGQTAVITVFEVFHARARYYGDDRFEEVG